MCGEKPHARFGGGFRGATPYGYPIECHECNEMFEVSNEIAEAMHHWREESGDPFLCVDCATRMAWGDAISAMDGECAGSIAGEVLRRTRPNAICIPNLAH